MSKVKIKVAFLDRDGVINREVNYLHKVDDFEYTEGCIEALKKLRFLGFQIIIVTNQAGIAKGYYTEREYHLLTQWYLDNLKAFGIKVLDVFYCPHHPDGRIETLNIVCKCRKPEPGMLLKAIGKYNIDVSGSILVGDQLTDIRAGKSAGIGNCYLVRSGHPFSDMEDDVEVYDSLFHFVENL